MPAEITPSDISVVIPTCQRPEKLTALLRSLHGESPREVLIAPDGPDGGESALVQQLDLPFDVRVFHGERAGPGAARNRAIGEAAGTVLLLLNDDVTASPGLLAQHAAAHAGRDASQPAMILGSAPWAIHEPDRLFDRLIRETSMVFFYNRMAGPEARDPDHDWGFRHAWTLNLSVLTATARAAGGFCQDLPGAAYEDLEWAWRLSTRLGAAVLYRPDARVVHDHRYEPDGYLEREFRMGRDAWALAGANPACARDLFGRDVRTRTEVAYARDFVERERTTAERLERDFRALAGMDPTAVRDPGVLELICGQHLLLKRWTWRRGLLSASGAAQAAA